MFDKQVSTVVLPDPGDTTVETLLVDALLPCWLDLVPAWVDPDWFRLTLTRAVRQLLLLPPGPELAAAVAALEPGPCRVDHTGDGLPGLPVPGSTAGFPCGCQIIQIAAWDAVTHWAAAQATKTLVQVMGAEPVTIEEDRPRPAITDPAREEVALAVRESPQALAARLHKARSFAAHPDLLDLQTSGGLTTRATATVLEQIGHLSDEDAHQVVSWLRDRLAHRRGTGARAWTTAEIRAATKRQATKCGSHPGAVDKARRDRNVQVWETGPGMGCLSATLPIEDAHRIHHRLTALANGLDDPRSMDQKRADLLVDLLLATPTGAPANRAEVNITIPLSTLLGGTEPADLTGVGPIDADLARELAADGTWRAWLTDTAGTIVATSSRTYRPSPALARLVRARNPYCRMPGCRTPAHHCDLDHLTPWPNGDSTAQNLQPLCRRHHIQKTHYGWTPTTTNTWTTPNRVTTKDPP